eukprot:15145337-Alexandrium_andersonii.AAC.1
MRLQHSPQRKRYFYLDWSMELRPWTQAASSLATTRSSSTDARSQAGRHLSPWPPVRFLAS